MKIFILLCFVAGAFAVHDCPRNSHYNSCGTTCPVTCNNYDNPPMICVKMCKLGCQCDDGYVETADGQCVRPESCPERTNDCPRNSHYDSCGTACPLTCNNYDNPPKFCVKMCKPGCHCDAGYVETADGHCVRPESCPEMTNDCPRNSHYDSCGTACPLTCNNYNNPPKICVLMCKLGCHCDAGYVENADGHCVRPESCPEMTNVQHALDRPDCDKAPEVGLCRGYFSRFYYDQEAGMCKHFVYGGCGGNRNNFETEFDCYNKCGALASVSACEQDKEVGPCMAAFRRYFYNRETGQCERFIYGGCRGNGNNFVSEVKCREACLD